jgi:hypothetical protein
MAAAGNGCANDPSKLALSRWSRPATKPTIMLLMTGVEAAALPKSQRVVAQWLPGDQTARPMQ